MKRCRYIILYYCGGSLLLICDNMIINYAVVIIITSDMLVWSQCNQCRIIAPLIAANALYN